MNAVIGVYESHDDAIAALEQLKKSGYPADQLSVIGKADLIDNHIHVKTSDSAAKAEASIGVVTGTVLGVLTGVGIFAIPGLGFLFGAGALVGAFAGVEMGLIAGGLAAILTKLGVDEVNAVKYQKHLEEGKFIIFAQGDDKQIAHAKDVIHTQGLHLEMDTN
jgi:hypothetical protein